MVDGAKADNYSVLAGKVSSLMPPPPLVYINSSDCFIFLAQTKQSTHSRSVGYQLDSIRQICFYLSPSATEFLVRIEWISVDWIFSLTAFFLERLNLFLSDGFARVYFSFRAL